MEKNQIKEATQNVENEQPQDAVLAQVREHFEKIQEIIENNKTEDRRVRYAFFAGVIKMDDDKDNHAGANAAVGRKDDLHQVLLNIMQALPADLVMRVISAYVEDIDD